MRDFLKSPWTENDDVWRHAYNAYSGSIGRWMKAVDSRDIVHRYYDFREKRLRELADEFLKDSGVQPAWR